MKTLLNLPQRLFSGLIKRLFKLCFKIPVLRQEAAFILKHYYFSSLELLLPVDQLYQCPVDDAQALLSFSEVFISKAYEEAFKLIPVPQKWIDMGCHRGYFSLYVLSLLAKDKAKKAKAVLIDADPRSQSWIKRLVGVNGLEKNFYYHQASVSDSPGPLVQFGLREGMLSAEGEDFGAVQGWVDVPKLDPSFILQSLEPPYELLKIDIEGAEFVFIETFAPVLEASQAILLEWHHKVDGQSQGFCVEAVPEGLARKLSVYGFDQKASLQGPTLVEANGVQIYTGLMLFTKK